MQLTPKQSFLGNKELVAAHARVVEQPSFQQACNLVLLQYMQAMPNGLSDFSSATALAHASAASANYYKLEGARQFLTLLLTIHEPPPRANVAEKRELNYRA